MQYLTEKTHSNPPSHVLDEDTQMLVPVRPLINSENTARLAELGIFPHRSINHPDNLSAVLGYTEWEFDEESQSFVRSPNGTPEEIQAELDRQESERIRNISVPRLHARIALIDAGLWSSVKTYFSSPERTEKELAFWDDAQNWNRNDPILVNAASALGLSEEQVDDLFEQAAGAVENGQ